MKVCPVCQARAFDDAATCFGCLYTFKGDEGQDVQEVTSQGSDSDTEDRRPSLLYPSNAELDSANASVMPTVVVENTLPSFVIQIRPEHEGSGPLSWTCKVDVVAS